MSPAPERRPPRGRSSDPRGARPRADAPPRRGGAPMSSRPPRRVDPRTGEPDERPRTPAPPLFEDAIPDLLDRRTREALAVLGDELALRVGRHLAAAGLLLDDDPTTALEHARYARARAARIAEVREALGVTAYVAGDFTLARAELRTARRMSGSLATLPLLADCERALGRPEEALALASSPGIERLDRADQLELLMVAAGARLDLGDSAQALRLLRVPEIDSPLDADDPDTAVLRLRYVHAEALLADGQLDAARAAFEQVAGYGDELTDAAERLEQLDR